MRWPHESQLDLTKLRAAEQKKGSKGWALSARAIRGGNWTNGSGRGVFYA